MNNTVFNRPMRTSVKIGAVSMSAYPREREINPGLCSQVDVNLTSG